MANITDDQWQRAQVLERSAHSKPFFQGYKDYKITYAQYFHYLDINRNLGENIIVEVGPADFPALAYCKVNEKCYIIEPMPSKHLHTAINNLNIQVITEKAETLIFPKSDEVWFFNVLQHTQDPDKIIKNAKQSTNIIRFFEPINYPVDKMHLHMFTLEYFKKHFGGCVKHYRKNNHAKHFHTWECAYGVYIV